jgi:membrane fusion protein (multidrug efflux system)
MADALLKFPKEEASKAPGKASLVGFLRARARLVLLVVVPALALVVGLWIYLAGGRYISTDNAYVGAQKVLVTPDISGKIATILVKEGQHVAAGDTLFEIDPTPFRLALTQARGRLEGVRTDFNNLKSNLKSLNELVDLSLQNVELKQKDVQRKAELLAKSSGAPLDLETAKSATVTAQLEAQFAIQQRASTLNSLLGDPDLPIEQYPPYVQAKAALDQAQRDLDHTVLKAAIAGTATQVDNIQLGRFVTAGMPVFSIIDYAAPWVDANPKETDVTDLRLGQKATIYVDAFPDRTFHGTVTSISPGTGAQFAILPPQNAIGNWVKVVQRLPLRISFDPGQDVRLLRAGMSATIDIDTGHSRSLAELLGLRRAPAAEPEP